MQAFMTFIDWLDRFTIIVAAVTSLYSALSWRYQRKHHKKQLINIVIRLTYTGPTNDTYQTNQCKQLPQTIKRKYFSRSELQGTLGNCYNGDGKYNLPYLATTHFAAAIEQVQNGDSDELHIHIDNPNTFAQFMATPEPNTEMNPQAIS